MAGAGKTIAAEVTPQAQTGTSPGLPVVSNAVVPNSAPVAQNVTLNANAEIAVAGALFTARYKYFDADGDLEGASAMRWLRNGVAITDASGKSYAASNNDVGQMLVFEVTPKAASGALSGVTTLSNGVTINKTYAIGGTVSNLIGNGLSLSLSSSSNSNPENLAISANGRFTFATPVASGSTYTLTITNNPKGQDCQFANSTKIITGGVSNSAVSEALSCYARKFNDTGITANQCYQAGGALAACNSAVAIALNPAQDGMIGRDANPATNDNTDGKLGFNFTSVAGGCVQDNVTGLMWEVKTADGGLRDWSKTYTHYDNISAVQKSDGTAPTQAEVDATTNSIGFKAAVNSQALCGFSDWRLPTADELRSIVDYGVAVPPTVDANWLPNTQSNTFWSVSPYVGIGTDAWNVNFRAGHDGVTYRGNAFYVRLVRAAGQLPALPRYTVSADGQEVTDSQSNLIWRRCSEGMSWDSAAIPAPTCVGTANLFTHEAALQRTATVAASTGIAWRLPNIKELGGIADKSLSNPAIDATTFPATPTSNFWSASPYVFNSSAAGVVFFHSGNVGISPRGNALYMRLVRTGQ